MENCWQLSPDNRPKFNAIVTELEASLEDSGKTFPLRYLSIVEYLPYPAIAQ